jgi:hypothetical protein
MNPAIHSQQSMAKAATASIVSKAMPDKVWYNPAAV